MAERPALEAVIAAVEQVKGRDWAEFRDEYGDTGRDMALYLGRRLCGMKLAELAKAAGLRNYGVVAANAKRYELRLARDRAEKARMKQVLELLNCECDPKSVPQLRAALADNPFVKGEGLSPKARRELLGHSQMSLEL